MSHDTIKMSPKGVSAAAAAAATAAAAAASSTNEEELGAQPSATPRGSIKSKDPSTSSTVASGTADGSGWVETLKGEKYLKNPAFQTGLFNRFVVPGGSEINRLLSAWTRLKASCQGVIGAEGLLKDLSTAEMETAQAKHKANPNDFKAFHQQREALDRYMVTISGLIRTGKVESLFKQVFEVITRWDAADKALVAALTDSEGEDKTTPQKKLILDAQSEVARGTADIKNVLNQLRGLYLYLGSLTHPRPHAYLRGAQLVASAASEDVDGSFELIARFETGVAPEAVDVEAYMKSIVEASEGYATALNRLQEDRGLVDMVLFLGSDQMKQCVTKEGVTIDKMTALVTEKFSEAIQQKVQERLELIQERQTLTQERQTFEATKKQLTDNNLELKTVNARLQSTLEQHDSKISELEGEVKGLITSQTSSAHTLEMTEASLREKEAEIVGLKQEKARRPKPGTAPKPKNVRNAASPGGQKQAKGGSKEKSGQAALVSGQRNRLAPGKAKAADSPLVPDSDPVLSGDKKLSDDADAYPLQDSSRSRANSTSSV